MPEKTKYVSLTDRRIATLKGHVLLFKALEPTEVPAGIETELAAAGIVPEALLEVMTARASAEAAMVKANKALDKQVDAPLETVLDDDDDAQPSPEFDKVKFEVAVREVIAKNDPDELTDAGNPKVKAVEALCGFKVTPIHIRNFLRTLEG